MKIHPLANGRARGLGFWHSLFDFFLPLDGTIIRREQKVHSSSKTGKVSYHFFTFRNLVAHYAGVWVLMPLREVRGMMQTIPNFARAGVIAFDQKTHQTDGGGAVASKTIAVTCTGTNLYLIDFNEGSSGASDAINSSTYNSVNLVQQQSFKQDSGRWLSTWTLAGPSTGANNLVVSSSPSDIIGCSINSFSGVNQSNTPDSSNKATLATGTPIVYTTTVVASNCWIISFTHGADLTADVGPNARGETTADGYVSGDSNATVGTGSQSLQWKQTAGAGATSGLIISFAPAAAAVAAVSIPDSTLLMMGV